MHVDGMFVAAPLTSLYRYAHCGVANAFCFCFFQGQVAERHHGILLYELYWYCSKAFFVALTFVRQI